MITISVMLAAILQVMETTIANVALPHIQGSLSATQDQSMGTNFLYSERSNYNSS